MGSQLIKYCSERSMVELALRLMMLSAQKKAAAEKVHDAAQYPIDFTLLNCNFVDQSKDDGTP